ncbi:MAG: hypothetical protein ABGW97_03100 [Christiangramia sp.]|uniref:hypothetical protein n=1 Tax=Christiangramia sp. TaxID=1931228 RepID=UPI003242D34E
MNANFTNQLNLLLKQIPEIPSNREFWLIRTEGGQFFESFQNYNYVAIGHEEIPYKKIFDLKNTSKNEEHFKSSLKDFISEKLPEKQPGLVAGQLTRFIYEVKKGDIVVAPSENSKYIAIGQITGTPLMEVTENDITRTECDYRKRKSVKWITTISKRGMDPLLYKVLQSHQAINNISHYDNIIQRSIGDFYKLNGKANLIVNVNREKNVKANDLLFFGSDLLRLTQDFIDDYNLGLDTSLVDIKININSKGKTQLLSKEAKIILILGLMVIGLNGGGFKFDNGVTEIDMSTDGLIKNVIEYQNNYHDRRIIDELMKSKDSLEITNNEDLLKYLKQFSTNKDLPK